ncbi:ATPase, P-type (transporting), HAD superfamily, subfamily IC [Flavobacterium fryxellicola]|nr:ATPase, P-type (transporting), HAD superfamily, subfamily IC [Flavobacterium fryxellicola]
MHDKEVCAISKQKLTTKNATEDVECCTLDSDLGINSEQDHDHGSSTGSLFALFLPAMISFVLLVLALLLDHFFSQSWFLGWIRIIWYVVAYLPVGFPVLKKAFHSSRKGAVFSEFFLMSIATVGAFRIGQYAEGVTVMLFYPRGELFQMLAVKKAKSNIKSLLDQRPDFASVIEGQKVILKKASEVALGKIIELKAGEKLALDGKLLSPHATFNTAALFGEIKPDFKSKGDVILAGMITAAIEAKSTHPVGSALIEFANNNKNSSTTNVIEVIEIPGLGLKGIVDGNEIAVGSSKLMKKLKIDYDKELDRIPFTTIAVAINQKYAGYFLIADEIKEDAKTAIAGLHKIKIKTMLLSGDNQAVVTAVAKELNIKDAFGGLLPEDKVKKVEALLKQQVKVAFVGDGVNDAPVIAIADVGIALGGLGSDATIETADIVI